MLRLEKLEIGGFKSFADRTVLLFGEGITGVVGPNGCGKSNIAEAISWVLGEQSAKSLRGGKMEDVIFNGTRDRKPTGMAEVILTLVADEDVFGREGDSSPLQDRDEYDEAVTKAEIAASSAQVLVDEVSRSDEETSGGDQEGTPKLSHPEAARSFKKKKRPVITISAGERITVGRRLYRTGDSEYLMNGRACLLRDIQDLFAGTGLGGAHYAIIEQGRIGQILSSKPLDRRALIEEAAGITKFKSRKRAAELKLEAARQNLSRLNDIISEVERQVNSLKRQAQKARRFQRLREEMRVLQKVVFTSEYHRISDESDRLARELEELSKVLHRAETDLSEREKEYKAVSMAARAAEDRLSTLKERAAAVELEIDRVRNRKIFEERQISELTARIAELERDQRVLQERLDLLDGESQRILEDVRSIESALRDEQTSLLAREGEYQQKLANLRAAESEIDAVRQELLQQIGATERLKNMAVSIEDELKRLELRRSERVSELELAGRRLEETRAEFARLIEHIGKDRARLSDLTKVIADRASIAGGFRSRAQELRSRVESVHAERSTAESRVSSLEDLDAHHAYYSTAVQEVMSPEQGARFNAIGTLADFVNVEPQYERLVESLFGAELQCVLVPTIDDALAGVEFIKSEGLGRGAFLVVGLHGAGGDQEDDPPWNDDERPSVSHAPGSPLWTVGDGAVDGETPRIDSSSGLLSEVVSLEAPLFELTALSAVDLLGLRPEIKSVVERAFADKCAARVVPDIEAALHLSIENPSRIYVNPEGELVIQGRLIVTGARAGREGASLLGLKREIRQLKDQSIGLLEVELEQALRLGETLGQLEVIDTELTALDGEFRRLEKLITSAESRLEALGRDLEREERHVALVESDLERYAEERRGLDEKLIEVRAELVSAEESRAQTQESLARGQERLAEMRGSVEQMAESLSAARASAAARAERVQSARSELRRVESESEELRSRINRNRLELFENHGRVDQLAASHAECDGLTARLETERATLAGEISQASESLDSARKRLDELEAVLAGLRKTVAGHHENKSRLEIGKVRVESEAEHLVRTCHSELAISLEDVVLSVQMAMEDSSGETGRLMSETEGTRARLDELRQKLDEMGPVNMMALEELEETEQRFEFLSGQRDDILDSIKSTEDALSEIKRRSRERFRHAFESINVNFQQMFVELFGGGRGEMILIDEDDVLESGIDLIAQPPGKRLQNVLLLSGGEKAMAAIALVLAIFQFRPSPFCILDEVDAPLDEVNVGRFAEKLVEMSSDTQFLVITHNKRTMESTRALYGVTMEEPGVSKLVSVKF